MRIPNSVGRVIIAAGAVLVLGGSAVGIAAAQAQPASTPTSTPYQKFLDALAARLGISSQQLQTDIGQARQDAGLPAGEGFPGRGPGPGGPRGFGGGLDLRVAAQTLGITQQQLQTQLAGKTLTQVATDNGKNPADLATALKNAAHTQLDNRIDQLMNQVIPQGAGQNAQPAASNTEGGRPGGPRGGFGFGPGMLQQGLNDAAQAIGITADQLKAQLPGKSLAQVATANGKNPTDVATALKNTANQQIDTRIDQQMTQTIPQRGNRGNSEG